MIDFCESRTEMDRIGMRLAHEGQHFILADDSLPCGHRHMSIVAVANYMKLLDARATNLAAALDEANRKIAALADEPVDHVV